MYPLSKIEHQVAGYGQEAFDGDPWAPAGMASAIDPDRDGRDGSQVPLREGRGRGGRAVQTVQLCYGRGGERMKPPVLPVIITAHSAKVNWLHP